MSFASSAARSATSPEFVPGYNPALQMLEDFLVPFRSFADALGSVARAPAQVAAYADWRTTVLDDYIQSAMMPARAGYAHLPEALRSRFEDLAHELDCKAVAAIVLIRRQQRSGRGHDLAFIEACRRGARSLNDAVLRFEAALDPLVEIAPKPASQHHHTPSLELVTNVTLG